MTETRPGPGLASPLMSISGLTKDFPGLRALDRFSLDLESGSIVAVVGHNGSGKSTLVKMLAGVYDIDEGSVEFSEHDGDRAGLYVIHQDLGLIPQLTAVDNLELIGGALTPVRAREEAAHAAKLFARFGEKFPLDVPVSALSPAQRSIVAIARALAGWQHDRNVLILDEPTEALHASEVEILFDAVRQVAARGAGVIFISHRLDEVLSLADRIVVLRDGVQVADSPRSDIDHERLVGYLTGDAAHSSVDESEQQATRGEPRLQVRGLTGQSVASLDLDLRAGEVVGISGVLGSGREGVASLLFGATPGVADSFVVEGSAYDKRSPEASIRRGIAFVPGDRVRHGSIPSMSVLENVTLPELTSLRNRAGALRLRKEAEHVDQLLEDFDVKPRRRDQMFSRFSGGNQQKVVFAKWLRNNPRVLILEEPTQGVDVGAKESIYHAIRAQAARGTAVVVVSSDAKELLRISDRVLVMRGGSVADELAGVGLSEDALIRSAYGLPADDSRDLTFRGEISE